MFVVVSDAFPTETTELADVVLPAALWGEKTGTFTNADRTVHLAEMAVDPPGEARSDLDIWLDYARRLDLRDRSGRPLPPWDTPEAAFDAWRECSRGRPCDYTGLSYDLLRVRRHPVALHRRAARWHGAALHRRTFGTHHDYCEDYGHDLTTGAPVTAPAHAAARSDGRARLKAVPWTSPPEPAGEGFPMVLNTGRTAVHFHTRTKTGRVPELDEAAPEAWAELHDEDCVRLGVSDGDLVLVESARGRIRVPVRVSEIRPGTVFVPFHYGDLDGGGQAANDLTLTAWDPVSKQPLFKDCAVRVRRADEVDGTPGSS